MQEIITYIIGAIAFIIIIRWFYRTIKNSGTKNQGCESCESCKHYKCPSEEQHS